MGKLHSKLSSKRRQNPEGGVLVSNLLNSQKEVEQILSNKNMCRDMKGHNYLLKVKLPPEKGLGHSSYVQSSKQSKKEHTHSADGETFAEDARQEWLITLCNFDNSKEDMSNLLHGVCKAIEASVKPSSDSSTALKIKIVLSPSNGQNNVSQNEKEQVSCLETGNPVRGLYCEGENIERRNHYLDLAGIENYSSKFDIKESSSQKPHSAPQHHPLTERENYIHPEPPQVSSPTLYSIKNKPACKEERSSRLHGQHPASWCQPTHFQKPTYAPLHRSHSKRLRTRDSDVLARQSSSCSPLVVRHEHHHLHEHHHHHHYPTA